MVGTVSAIAVAIAPVTKMEILMTHMISCSEACAKEKERNRLVAWAEPSRADLQLLSYYKNWHFVYNGAFD